MYNQKKKSKHNNEEDEERGEEEDYWNGRERDSDVRMFVFAEVGWSKVF